MPHVQVHSLAFEVTTGVRSLLRVHYFRFDYLRYSELLKTTPFVFQLNCSPCDLIVATHSKLK